MSKTMAETIEELNEALNKKIEVPVWWICLLTYIVCLMALSVVIL